MASVCWPNVLMQTRSVSGHIFALIAVFDNCKGVSLCGFEIMHFVIRYGCTNLIALIALEHHVVFSVCLSQIF
jgi:hypothetical protein